MLLCPLNVNLNDIMALLKSEENKFHAVHNMEQYKYSCILRIIRNIFVYTEAYAVNLANRRSLPATLEILADNTVLFLQADTAPLRIMHTQRSNRHRPILKCRPRSV